MDRVDLLKFCNEALAHYGVESQVTQAIEECRELDFALFSWREDGSELHQESVIDEIADVLIMAEQMRIAFGADAVDERIRFKVERQRKRMKEGE